MQSEAATPPSAGTDSGHAYYATNYPDYLRQNPDSKLAFYLGLLRKWVKPGDTVFELGVGLGVFLTKAQSLYACAGCDINEYGVGVTRTLVPACPISVGSYECISRQPAPAAVVAWDVLEHLPNLREGLATIHARLRSGGALIAVVPLYDGPLGWLVKLLDKDTTHVSKWSRGQWLDTLRAAGFEVVDYGGIVRRLLGSWYMHITAPQFLLRPIGSALYFVARKPLEPSTR